MFILISSYVFVLLLCNRIKHTYILDDPFDDPPQLAELVPERSPEGKPADEVTFIVGNCALIVTHSVWFDYFGRGIGYPFCCVWGIMHIGNLARQDMFFLWELAPKNWKTLSIGIWFLLSALPKTQEEMNCNSLNYLNWVLFGKVVSEFWIFVFPSFFSVHKNVDIVQFCFCSRRQTWGLLGMNAFCLLGTLG